MIKNKFAKWIEWLLDLLPLFAVLFSCLYVTFNSNAFESYYGETVNEEIKTYYDTDDLVENNHYYLQTTIATNKNTETYHETRMYVTNLVCDGVSYPTVEWIRYYYTNNYNTLQLMNAQSVTQLNIERVNTTALLEFDFLGFTGDNYFEMLNGMYYTVSYNNYSYLNNSFTYALSQFNDLGFDKLNFINFFTGLFLNGTSNVYTTFINGYLNYFLLVECTYVLPMVLYWFIHLGERLISKLEYGGDN